MVNAIKGQQIQIAALSERVFSLSKVVQVDRSTLQALRIENDQVKERLKKLMAIVCGERADDPACQ
jgi:FtsZ-binding cell division protein ZapB